MAGLFPFANVGRISPIITHCADYVELFMRTYIALQRDTDRHNIRYRAGARHSRKLPQPWKGPVRAGHYFPT